MMGLNNLGTAVTVVIAVTLTALMVEILYFLWRRRRSYRPRSRVEPQEHSLPTSSPPSSSFIAERERELELEFELEQQVMKYQCHYGISRVLFTIKEEEEREGFDSESGECSAVKTVSLSEVVVVVDDGGNGDLLVNETTPFSTPCASPPYFTPHSSPFHDYYYNNNVANNG